jgi:hypothetical protein
METVDLQVAPIIVTAEMAPADAAWADGLRRRHFPPERNHLPAHITLFHHLPPSCEQELKALLSDLVRSTPPTATIDGVISLGKGVALALRSADLLVMRARIADRFELLLSPQDRHPPRLHITVQNKVEQGVAKATFAQLSDQLKPRPLAIRGLACWHYRGGPWSPIARYSFRG